MTELKKIVVDSFPIERLPDELRGLLEAGEPVRITLEQGQQRKDATLPAFGFAKGTYAKHGLDPVEYIRQLRDEWN